MLKSDIVLIERVIVYGLNRGTRIMTIGYLVGKGIFFGVVGIVCLMFSIWVKIVFLGWLFV